MRVFRAVGRGQHAIRETPLHGNQDVYRHPVYILLTACFPASMRTVGLIKNPVEGRLRVLSSHTYHAPGGPTTFVWVVGAGDGDHPKTCVPKSAGCAPRRHRQDAAGARDGGRVRRVVPGNPPQLRRQQVAGRRRALRARRVLAGRQAVALRAVRRRGDDPRQPYKGLLHLRRVLAPYASACANARLLPCVLFVNEVSRRPWHARLCAEHVEAIET